MSYNLFLDDVRDANKFLKDIRTWVTVRNYDQFTKIITEHGLPKFISFDHDLEPDIIIGDPVKNLKTCKIQRSKTGYDCAKWLVEYCIKKQLPLPAFQVHSLNTEGKKNIQSILESFNRSQKENI